MLFIADFDRLIVGMESGLECKTVPPYSGDATVKVTMQMSESLGISEDEIFAKAVNNMKKDGYNIQDIFAAIAGMVDEEIVYCNHNCNCLKNISAKS